MNMSAANSDYANQPSPVRAWYQESDREIYAELDDGQLLHFCIDGNPYLEVGTPVQLNNIELSPDGLHWPDLDEDLSIAGILAGDYGQRTHATA